MSEVFGKDRASGRGISEMQTTYVREAKQKLDPRRIIHKQTETRGEVFELRVELRSAFLLSRTCGLERWSSRSW